MKLKFKYAEDVDRSKDQTVSAKVRCEMKTWKLRFDLDAKCLEKNEGASPYTNLETMTRAFTRTKTNDTYSTPCRLLRKQSYLVVYPSTDNTMIKVV